MEFENFEQPHPLRPGKSSVPVLIAGLASSAVTLFLVWLLNQLGMDFNIMSFYVMYVVPVGAILVGLVAGLGYSLMSWHSGMRISKSLLSTIVLLQIVFYFAAQYIEYKYLISQYPGGEQITFLEYFDISSRQFAFEGKDGSIGEPLGAWGYIFRVLEIIGFVFGGLITPLILKSRAYCDTCQMYMRSKELVMLPAGQLPKKIRRKNKESFEEYQAQEEAAFDEGQQLLEDLRKYAGAGKLDRFRKIVEEHMPHKKEYNKLSQRIIVKVSHCPGCFKADLEASLVSGQGDKIKTTKLGSTPANAEIARMKF
jgi:hypothetical protein